MLGLTEPQVAGLFMLLWLGPILYLVRRFWEYRRNLSVKWFVLGSVSAGLWVFVLGITPLVPSQRVAEFLLYRVRTFGTASSVFIFLFILEYSIGRTLSRRTVLAAVLVPTLTLGILWTRPALFMDVQVSPGGFYSFELAGVGVVHVLYIMLLHVSAIALMIRELLTTSGTQQRQVTAVLGGYIVGIAPVFFPVLGLLPNYFNPGVVGLLVFLSVTAYALDRFGLFVTSPMDKDAVFREIEDAVVVLNAEGNVTDMNRVARELFGVGDNYVGLAAAEVFSEYPELETAQRTHQFSGTVTTEMGGRERYFTPSVTPLEYGRGMTGTILVFRDITQVENREQELDLLRQVFSRVFRHNVRNELHIARGYVDLVHERADDGTIETDSKIAMESLDRFLAHVEKVREAEALIVGNHELSDRSLPDLVSAAVATFEESHPEVDITSDVHDVDVAVVDGFATAIENAIGNAVQHNGPAVTVDLSSEVAAATVTVVIEDDGDGIAEMETEAIMRGRETSMVHGSGVGLWLMKWCVEKSKGELAVTDTGDGTRVEITLPRSRNGSLPTH
jgi:PAS domain S-box-containing protein